MRVETRTNGTVRVDVPTSMYQDLCYLFAFRRKVLYLKAHKGKRAMYLPMSEFKFKVAPPFIDPAPGVFKRLKDHIAIG